MTAPAPGMVRVNVYESDPFATFVGPVASEYEDYFELLTALVEAFKAAEAARIEAAGAITAYIADNKIEKVEVDW